MSQSIIIHPTPQPAAHNPAGKHQQTNRIPARLPPQRDAAVATEVRRDAIARIGALAVLHGSAGDKLKGGGRDEEVGAVGAAADFAAVLAVAECLCVCGTQICQLYCRVICGFASSHLEVYLTVVGDCAFSAYCSFATRPMVRPQLLDYWLDWSNGLVRPISLDWFTCWMDYHWIGPGFGPTRPTNSQ